MKVFASTIFRLAILSIGANIFPAIRVSLMYDATERRP